jgi:SAM-dependent methyltransferase
MGTQFDREYSRVTKSMLLTLGGDPPNQRILDVGTGDGDLWEFAPSSCEWYGIDISEVGVRRALDRFPALHGAVAVSEWLPYPDHHFGRVIAADAIEHVFDLPQTLSAIKRVIAPGGTFAFSVPAPDSLRKWGYNRLLRGAPSIGLMLRLAGVVWRRTWLFGKPMFQPIDRDIDLAGWHTTLADAGFKIVDCQEWPTAPLKPIVYLLSAKVD